MVEPLIFVAMPESLVTKFFPGPIMAELCGLGQVVLSPTPSSYSSPQSRDLLARANVIITGWGSPLVDVAVLDSAPALRAVVHSAGSVRAVASKDCYDRGVQISSQAWANALPVAEYSLAMILLAAKGVFRAQRTYRTARQEFDREVELTDAGTYRQRIGIIGASTIGRRVLELLSPFDLDIAVADPTLRAEDAAALGVTLLDLDELMATSAVVSVHAPLLPSTIGMIGARQLALLADGATLINTARGALVDQNALIQELVAGRFEAVLDVTDPEVPEPSSPLWDLPNLVLTPHVAGAVGNELHRLGASAAAEVGRVLRGEPLRHPVLKERYDATA